MEIFIIAILIGMLGGITKAILTAETQKDAIRSVFLGAVGGLLVVFMGIDEELAFFVAGYMAEDFIKRLVSSYKIYKARSKKVKDNEG